MSDPVNLSSRRSGAVALVFDNVEWGGKDVGDNSQFWRPATILRTYRSRDRHADWLADVRFHHDGRVSRGHFTNCMEDYGRVAA